jgi:hypothetical protein
VCLGSEESCESYLKGGCGWVINKPPIQDDRKSNDVCEKKNPKREIRVGKKNLRTSIP